MDFHTLSRKQLQALCKKNKIPANITNVAMADSLASLNQVEGLDDVMNPIEGDAGTPNVNLRTAARTTTLRKAAREEAVEQENKDANLPPITPAASRRRATAVSTRRKKEVEMVQEDDADKNVPKTPAAAPVSRRRATARSVCTTKMQTPSGASAQRTYNTRRSVRLLEKDLSKMSLVDTEDAGLVKIDDDDDVSQLEKGNSMQMDSTVVSEDTQELEVSSLEKNTEYECQSRDLDSEMKLVSEPHASNEAEPEKVNCLEAEPHASYETVSDVLEESSEQVTANKECFGRQDNFPVEASEDAFPEVTTVQDIAAVTDVVPDDVSVDLPHQEVAAADSLPMQSECNMDMDDQVSNEGDDAGSEVLPVLEESVVVMQDNASEDTATFVVADDQDVTDLLPISPVSANIEEFVECNTDDDDDQLINKGDNQDINETEHLNLAGGYQEEEELEAKPEQLAAETEKIDSDVTGTSSVVLALPKDAGLENCGAVIEVCTESSANGKESMEVKNVTTESSLPDVEAENLEVEAESEELVAGEDVKLEADNAFSSIQQVSVECDGSCKSNTMVGGDVASEDAAAAITNKGPLLSLETITEQKSTIDISVQSDQFKGGVLNNKTMGELKRMLKQLSLGNKTNADKAVEKKRTALQVLPPNQMTDAESRMAE